MQVMRLPGPAATAVVELCDDANIGARVDTDRLCASGEIPDLHRPEGHGLGLQPGPGVVDAFQPGAVGAVDIARRDAVQRDRKRPVFGVMGRARPSRLSAGRRFECDEGWWSHRGGGQRLE